MTQNLHYDLGEAEINGMKEFFTYAFYYGIIEFIPEIKFYEFEIIDLSAFIPIAPTGQEINAWILHGSQRCFQENKR